ncbi:MAG: molybdenum cofactor biosynthesis protein MoaE [Actinomyces oris]|uniref:molybdenum cofactor biosynthesis protein MoaE n=1 Tax=Actinomyces oris TaxID=544580 RepID=UPI003615DC3C
MTPSPDQPSRPLPAPTARVVRAEVTEAPISVTELADAVQDAAAGAVVTFEGVVRNHDAERAVTGIGYSCHPTAGQVVEQIARDVAQQGRVRALGVVHRVGDLSVGEVALAVAVSSDHRAEAFAVCSQIVEEVKKRLPVWKRQTFTDGSSQWSNIA